MFTLGKPALAGWLVAADCCGMSIDGISNVPIEGAAGFGLENGGFFGFGCIMLVL